MAASINAECIFAAGKHLFPLGLQLATRFRAILGSTQLSQSCTALVGVVFGIYPALRAAQMDPVEALRHEQLAPRLPA